MLTDPLLIGHVNAGRLREWQAAPGVPTRVIRTLLLSPDVFDEVHRNPWQREPEDRSNADARERRRSLHAVVGRFVAGQRLAPRTEIELLNPQLDPAFRDLFEFRSGPPRPQSRLFAYVFAPGTWVALLFRLRSELGDFGDPRRAQAARVARQRWAGLFGSRPPFSAVYPCDSFAKLRALCDAP